MLFKRSIVYTNLWSRTHKSMFFLYCMNLNVVKNQIHAVQPLSVLSSGKQVALRNRLWRESANQRESETSWDIKGRLDLSESLCPTFYLKWIDICGQLRRKGQTMFLDFYTQSCCTFINQHFTPAFAEINLILCLLLELIFIIFMGGGMDGWMDRVNRAEEYNWLKHFFIFYLFVIYLFV